MDLTNFQLIRKPRSSTAHVTLVARPLGELTAAVERIALDEGMKQASAVAKQWLDDKPPVEHWASHTPDTHVQKVLALIANIDHWLIERGDRPAGKEFAEVRTRLLKAPDPRITPDGLAEARALISDGITAHLVTGGPRNQLSRLCRWLLIADLLNEELVPDALLRADDDNTLLWDWIHRRDIITSPELMGVVVAQGPCVELVRQAAVADLFVVRSEWSCYRAGEIASITNILANSSLEIENKVTREEETIERTETERIESSEQVEEDRTQTELSREVDRTASLQADINGSVSASGSYGFTQFSASASAGVSASLSENLRNASKISRDMLSKAVAKVESRVREERIRRVTRKTEDIVKHVINNQKQPHLNGVYRWVDRIDRYQVFRYPHRLLLEFQIPEPAEYLRWRMDPTRTSDSLSVAPPPAFDVNAATITAANYTQLGLIYRASNMPPPPDQEVSVTSVVKATYTGDAIKNREVQWIYPKLEGSASVTLPTGYLAYEVGFDGAALPFRANWRVENEPAPVDERGEIEGFHQITLSIAAGASTRNRSSDGTRVVGFTVQLGTRVGGERSTVRFADAVLTIPSGQRFPLSPSVRDKVDVGFIAAGAASAIVTFHIRCRPTDSALEEWRNAVYDSLLDAWRGWDQEWRTAQLQRRATGGPQGWDRTSRSRNKEIIQDEFKRQIIAWLLDEQNFAGRPAMAEQANSWDRMDLVKSKAVAPIVQFFEQAFEWGNLTYVCYPYYWARDGQWDALNGIEAADPQLAQFLRAGSARVIVPARPGMEEMVKYWLIYCEPFLGGPLPIPNTDGYISIAQEIRDLTAPPSGGEPGASWEAQLGTPLLWLDKDDGLPENERRRLGKAPNQPDETLC
jgi:hypothetical protein